MQFELMGVAQRVCLISLDNLVTGNKVTNLENRIMFKSINNIRNRGLTNLT